MFFLLKIDWEVIGFGTITADGDCSMKLKDAYSCQAGDTGLISGLRKSPQEGNEPTAVFLPGKSHGHRNMVGYSPWGSKTVRYDLITKPQQLH